MASMSSPSKLEKGELGWDETTNEIKIGDGVTLFSSLTAIGGGVGSVDWSTITGKPTTFTPSTHTHPQSDITNLTTDLAAKKTDSMSTNRLLGRGTAGTGAIEEITLGTNLSLSGTTLNATGGGSVTVEDVNLIIGMRFFGF